MTRSSRPRAKLGKRGIVVLGGATVAVAAIGLPAAAALSAHTAPATASAPGAVAAAAVTTSASGTATTTGATTSTTSSATTTTTGATTSTTGATTTPTTSTSSTAPTTTPGFTVSQSRLADTRKGDLAGPVSGLYQVQTDVPAGDTVELTITATNASGPGYITAYPNGQSAPYASNVNFTAGKTYSSTAVVQVGDDGIVDLNVVNSSTDVIVDELGYTTAGTFVGATPQRVGDSRKAGNGFVTTGPYTGAVTLTLPEGSVPTGAGVVALNVTAVPSGTGAGYVSVYTGGTTAPGTSALNFNGGATNTNLVFVKPSANGSVTFTVANSPANLVVDLDGYAPAGSSLTAVTPSRIANSKSGQNLPQGLLTGAHAFTVPSADIPTGTSAVILNVTIAQATGSGYANTYPTGSSPYTSQVQFGKGQTIAQTIVVPVGTNGSVTVNVVGASGYVLVDYEGTIGQDSTSSTSTTSAAPTGTATSTSVTPSSTATGTTTTPTSTVTSTSVTPTGTATTTTGLPTGLPTISFGSR